MRAKLFQAANGQYRIGFGPLLLFSACFVVWQMGVLFYAGSTMSVFGRTPIPLAGEVTAVIAAGYAVSILAICLFPRKTVYMERAVLPPAWLCTLLMLFPFPPQVIARLFCVCAFVCAFSIGVMASLAAQHFTLDTTWRDGIAGMVVGGVLIALLQNEYWPVSFTAFTVFSLLLLAGLTAFHYLLPARITVPYAAPGAQRPGILFFGLWLLSGFSTLLLCFASSFAESVRGGISVLYLSGAVMAALLYALGRRFKARSIRLFGGFFALCVPGFVLAYLSLSLPALGLWACVLLGFTVALASLWIFFAAAAFALWPTRFIGAIGAALGLGIMLLHSGLLRLFRENVTLLYGLYAVSAVALLLIYYFLEPYLSFALQKRQAQEPAPQAPHPFDALSEQERNLAALILAGHTETSVARCMHITLNTQKSYRRNLYAKLDIHSKRELFELASRGSAGDAGRS